MKKKTVFVTGMSGYVGSVLCRELDRKSWCKKFYGMDVKEPLAKYKKGTFRKMDLNDPGLVDWVKEIKPDIVVHLAFVLNPMFDENLMTHINVNGSKNVLAAMEAADVPQALIVSSATAYGAFADNPVPLKETDPIRKHPHFSYASDKAELEKMSAEYMEKHPDTIFSIIRPCIIYGPGVDNYLSYLFTLPVAMVPSDHETHLQFVHDDDVVGSILHILQKEGRGAFNVAPADTLSMQEIHAIAGKTPIALPDWIVEKAFDWTWKMRLPIAKVPPSFYDYVRFPWVLDSSRLTDELGYKFLYSTEETIKIMFRAKGIKVVE